MARMSIEQKLADQVHAIMMRADFRPEMFSFYISRCGYVLHQKMFDVFVHMISLWATDYDNQITRDNDEYLKITIRARQIQDLIDKWKVKSG